MDQPNRFLSACRNEPTDCAPVWLMRQAGRYMKEYRELREQYPILTLCKTPELAARVTLQPVRRFEVDAAIIFADILLPVEPMGFDLEFAKGEGPVIHNPVRSMEDVKQLWPVAPEESLSYVGETIRIVRRELDCRIPVIGFAGAPFTLASYLIEEGSSGHYLRTKGLMHREPEAWHRLMGHLAVTVRDYLLFQVRSGAQAVQLFDSWAGALSPADYREYVLPHSRTVLAGVAESGVPVIHFSTGTAGLLPLLKEAGGSVIGIDWRISLKDARRLLGADVPVQGNLDPAVLLAPLPVIRREVERVLAEGGGRGHIFNLGHGVLPETDPAHVEAVVSLVHELSRPTPSTAAPRLA